MITTFKNKSIWNRVFISTIFLMVLICLSNTFVGLFNSVLTSVAVGDIATASLTLSNTVDKTVIAIGELFAIGCQIIVTKYLVDGDKAKAQSTFNLIFLISICFGIVLMTINLACYKFIPIMLSAGMSISKNVLESSSSYLLGFSIGIPFTILNHLIIMILYIDGEKRLPKIAIILNIIVNCTTSVLFVKYLTNKILFIGLASSISTIISFLILIVYFFKKKSIFKINFKIVKYGNLKDVLINGLPMAFKYLAISVKLFLLNIIMISIGNIAGKNQSQILLTARGAQDTISILFETPISAILLTTILMGSFYFNENNDYDMKNLNKNILMFILLFIVPLSLIYFFISPYLATWYLPDNSPSLNLCIYGMKWMAFGIIFLSLNTLILGYMQATRNKLLTFTCITLQSLILPIVFISIFGFTIGPKGVFIGLFVNILVFIPIYLVINLIVNKTIPKNFNDFMFLPKSFGYDKNNQLNISLFCKDDLNYFENKYAAFCNYNNITQPKEQLIRNKIDEMFSLVFVETRNKRMNIRITIKNKNISLILTNNLPKQNINTIDSKNSNINKNLKSYDFKYNYFLKTNNIIFTY